VVITDRYVDSSLAYQGAGRALSLDDIRRLSRWATNGLRPDLTVLLDVDPDVGLQRARQGGRADRLERESLDFHQRVRRAFRALADAAPDRYLVVDASRQPETVAAVVHMAVAKRLAARLAAQRPLSRSERPPSALRWLRRSHRSRAAGPSTAGGVTAAPPTGSAPTPSRPAPPSPPAPPAASSSAPPAASSSADPTHPSEWDDAAGGLRR
jgi:dTMP kinase